MNRILVYQLGLLSLLSTGPTLQGQQVAATEVPAANTTAETLLAHPITVNLEHVSLRQAIDAIAASAKIHVLYRYGLLDATRTPVSVHMTKAPASDVFARVLTGTQLRIVPVHGATFSIVPSDENAQHAAVAGGIVGHVVDGKTKRPIKGAAVSLDHASKGVMSNDDGTFRIGSVAAGMHQVTVKAVGYQRQVRSVTVSDTLVANVDFALEAGVNQLDQVVVTGMVVATELKAVPNAITVITAKQIEERGITKIDQLFRGDVPGLFAQNQGSATPLDEVTMFSRGATALSDASLGVTGIYNSFITNPIKTYVDGIELADPKYLSQIDPKSVERIEILTGPQASTIYGSNAINGVMQIFTKRGNTSRPQLNLTLLSGWVENNFSSARTPQHDYSAQLTGIEGRLSYNAGGSWNYMGPWTPAKQMSRTGGFGGGRIELPVSLGRVTADVTLRRTITQNLDRGSNQQLYTAYRETGWWDVQFGLGSRSSPTTMTLTGQTLGVTLSYAPVAWWSHELGMGSDISDMDRRVTERGYAYSGDTNLILQDNHTDRRSLHYTTIARVPVTSFAQATVTVGADAWQNVTSVLFTNPQTLTGILNGWTVVSRQPGHNTGGFLQTQLGISDRLFFTYGLRAEWNPGYGEEAQPNYAPRYGVAYTQELGPVTAKLRGSFGRSTRPPVSDLKVEKLASQANSLVVPYYGDIPYYFANPALGPEHQQGGEGGLELYLGTRGSLVITRYNQTVDGLIAAAPIDSARSQVPCTDFYCRIYSVRIGPDHYGYLRQLQYVNLGSIRNQGWEFQGSVSTGPITTRGTYSWTKSRTIGVNPKYRAFFDQINYPQYQPGATFQFLPEHTWAVGITYARAATTIGINVTGTGRATNVEDDFYYRNLAYTRLPQNQLNMSPYGRYVSFNAGYALADLMVSHHFASPVEGVLQVQNLGNRYTNDLDAQFASMGRQVKLGMRLTVQ